MTPIAQQVTDALAQPPGAHPELLEPVMDVYFGNGNALRDLGDLHGDPVRADAMFRHLAGGRWTPALLRKKQVAMAFDWVLSLGFRDAPLAEVEAFTALNSIPIARILEARVGADSADELLALSRRATSARVKDAALAAAIVATPAPPPGLEDELMLNTTGWPSLLRRALRALGPERASAVALRTLRRYDGGPDVFQALVPVLECFVAELSPAAKQAIGERVEELAAKNRELTWESAGERLGGWKDADWEGVIAFARARAGANAGWRRTLRVILSRRVPYGWALDPAYDELIDPAGAAERGYDVWKVVLVLLRAIAPARAEAVLAQAAWRQPADALRFLIPGLSDAMLLRLAELHVSLRDDPTQKDLLIATSLKPLGPQFGDALKTALAQVKPKPGYLKALQRNLEPPVYAALATWLTKRPAPKPQSKPRAGKAEAKSTSKSKTAAARGK